MEIARTLRRRINISRGMKGTVSYEATVDAEGLTEAELLAESDSLVKALDARYPAPVEEKKKE